MFHWKLAYVKNAALPKTLPVTVEALLCALPVIDAEVPGNFELDLFRAGKIEDPFYSTNTAVLQELEDMHLFYFTECDISDPEVELTFEGIDTVAEIYINGVLAARSENMFLPCVLPRPFRLGKNEIVVHIKPACLEARRYEVNPLCNAQPYNYESLFLRKAAHSFGWDIMPRIVSAGIYLPVTVKPYKKNRITDLYLTTHGIDLDRRVAHMYLTLNTQMESDRARDYSIRVRGVCRDSSFSFQKTLWHTATQIGFDLANCHFWYPKNYGAQDLYETTVELYRGEELCDSRTLSIGVRTVELLTSDSTPDGKIGEFCFLVNDQRVFLLGSNWVPLDAFHSRDSERLDRALAMLDDIGCNAVRVWGGGIYESDRFYDFCDRHGILVWQDFAMACAVYPQDEDFLRRLGEEATYQIKRLRNHASLGLLAGDNECDTAYRDFNSRRRDPNTNLITRKLLPDLVRRYAYTTTFLPSSPYISPRAYDERLPLPEDHLWGPRDNFKGDFYKNAVCRFVSETGYQGMPSPASLKKFLREPEVLFRDKATWLPTDEYALHASCPDTKDKSGAYLYRIGLTYRQTELLFGKASDDFATFLLQSQISQAEAKKYFIERVRLRKGECTGIIWWNLLDGWPQISDAVVDYYYTKKLAYHYIKRSQAPLCLMFDEPRDGQLVLHSVNEFSRDISLSYTVRDLYGGRPEVRGFAVAKKDASRPILTLPVSDGEQAFYLIEWESEDGVKGRNHYCTHLIPSDTDRYIKAMCEAGFDTTEGF